MKKIKFLVRKEFLQLKRDKRLLPIIFIAPIIQLIVLGYAVTFDVKNISIAVYDRDYSAASRELIEEFTSSGYFTLKTHESDYTGLEREIQSNNVRMGIVIPVDFEKHIKTGRSVPVQLLIDGTDSNTSTIGMAYAQQVILRFSSRHLNKRELPVKVSSINTEFRSWYNPELKSRYFMVPGILGLLLMIITTMLTSMVIVKEKEIGTMEQLIVTPIRPYQIIAGKMIPFIIIGFVDVTLVLLVSYFWFGVPIKGSIPLLYLFAGAFLLTTLGLGLFISTISRTQQQAMMATVFAFMLPFLYLSGFVFPIENMPQILQYVAHCIPLTYFFIIIRGIFLKGIGLAYLWDEFLILFLFGVAILTISALRFNKRLE